MDTLNDNQSESQSFKKYTIQDLLEAFKKAGFPTNRQWVYRQELKGNLVLPRSTTNFKKVMGTRTVGAVRLMSEEMINIIVEAFMPGGKGYFDWRTMKSKVKGGELN